MFCRIDISLLLLGSLLQFTASLGWIHGVRCFQSESFVLVSVVTTATRLTGATGTTTATTGAGSVGEGTLGTRRRLNTALGTTLVGLLRQLEDLTELHALVGLHRLLNVGEPGSHFV